MSTLTAGIVGSVELDGQLTQFKIVSGAGLGLVLNDTPYGGGKTYKTSPTIADVMAAAKDQGLLPPPDGLLAAVIGDHPELFVTGRIFAIGDGYAGSWVEGGSEPKPVTTQYRPTTNHNLAAIYLFAVAPPASS